MIFFPPGNIDFRSLLNLNFSIFNLCQSEATGANLHIRYGHSDCLYRGLRLSPVNHNHRNLHTRQTSIYKPTLSPPQGKTPKSRAGASDSGQRVRNNTLTAQRSRQSHTTATYQVGLYKLEPFTSLESFTGEQAYLHYKSFHNQPKSSAKIIPCYYFSTSVVAHSLLCRVLDIKILNLRSIMPAAGTASHFQDPIFCISFAFRCTKQQGIRGCRRKSKMPNHMGEARKDLYRLLAYSLATSLTQDQDQDQDPSSHLFNFKPWREQVKLYSSSKPFPKASILHALGFALVGRLGTRTFHLGQAKPSSLDSRDNSPGLTPSPFHLPMGTAINLVMAYFTRRGTKIPSCLRISFSAHHDWCLTIFQRPLTRQQPYCR